ncbi:hypothetical protein [Muriicola soli]
MRRFGPTLFSDQYYVNIGVHITEKVLELSGFMGPLL